MARFEAGDVSDQASLAALEPRPTLPVVSGLYELFAENALVRRSLAGLAAGLKPSCRLARSQASDHESEAWLLGRKASGWPSRSF